MAHKSNWNISYHLSLIHIVIHKIKGHAVMEMFGTKKNKKNELKQKNKTK